MDRVAVLLREARRLEERAARLRALAGLGPSESVEESRGGVDAGKH